MNNSYIKQLLEAQETFKKWKTQQQYVILPGEVISKYDGQVHFINSADLTLLYRVPPKQCVVATEDDPFKWSKCVGRIKLEPRYHGDYENYLVELWMIDLVCGKQT